MIEFNYKTTTNYNKVWGWLKTQRVIGMSSNGTWLLSVFYKQDERGNIVFMQRGFLHPYSYSTKKDFIECCKRDELKFVVPNEAHTNGICLAQLIDRMNAQSKVRSNNEPGANERKI